jgi:hypothetical protein
VTSQELLALADKVEGTRDPDLGREVLRACGWRQTQVGFFLGPLTRWSSPDSKVSFDDDDFARYGRDPIVSIDAAVSLVPPGLRLTFSEWDDEKHLRPRGPWQAILTKAGSGSSFNDMLGHRCDHAATPARAICAAALRALATSGSQHEGASS